MSMQDVQLVSLCERMNEMKDAKIVLVGLLAVALGPVGCGQPSATTPKDKGAVKDGAKKDTAKKDGGKEDEHVHGKGPNGGVVFDLGKHHAEFTADHDKKECTILVLGEDEKTLKPVAAKELTLTTKPTMTKEGKVVPPMTIKLLPKGETAGKASKYVGADPGLGNVAEFAGTILGEIDGKPSQGEFKE